MQSSIVFAAPDLWNVRVIYGKFYHEFVSRLLRVALRGSVRMDSYETIINIRRLIKHNI